MSWSIIIVLVEAWQGITLQIAASLFHNCYKVALGGGSWSLLTNSRKKERESNKNSIWQKKVWHQRAMFCSCFFKIRLGMVYAQSFIAIEYSWVRNVSIKKYLSRKLSDTMVVLYVYFVTSAVYNMYLKKCLVDEIQKRLITT